MTTFALPAPVDAERRPVLRREVWLVMLLSLGKSGVYAVVSFLAILTAGRPLSSNTASINVTFSPRPLLDLTYQLLSIFFTLVPVALTFHFLALGGERPTRVLGLDRSQPWRDLRRGVVLAAAVGAVGLAFYLASYGLGINLKVSAAGLGDTWWAPLILVARAIMNAVLEEVIVAGYFLHRLAQLGWSPWRAVALSAVVRGSYHLYQGIGGFLGNVAMGVLFGRLYQRWGRTAPLVIAHSLIDIVAFLGYAALHGRVSWLP